MTTAKRAPQGAHARRVPASKKPAKNIEHRGRVTESAEEPVLEQPQALTPAAARNELGQLQGWLQDFIQRQQQLDGVKQRVAFLSGFLAAVQPQTETPE